MTSTNPREPQIIARGELVNRHGHFLRKFEIIMHIEKQPTFQLYMNTRGWPPGLPPVNRRELLVSAGSFQIAFSKAQEFIDAHYVNHWRPKNASPLEQLAATLTDTQILDLARPNVSIPQWVLDLTSPS